MVGTYLVQVQGIQIELVYDVVPVLSVLVFVDLVGVEVPRRISFASIPFTCHLAHVIFTNLAVAHGLGLETLSVLVCLCLALQLVLAVEEVSHAVGTSDNRFSLFVQVQKGEGLVLGFCFERVRRFRGLGLLEA